MSGCRSLPSANFRAAAAETDASLKRSSWLAWGLSSLAGFVGQGGSAASRGAVPEPPTEQEIQELYALLDEEAREMGYQAGGGGPEGMLPLATRVDLRVRDCSSNQEVS